MSPGEDSVKRPKLDDILGRAARQDPEALAELVELYGSRVFGLLFRLTGQRELAEDLMQETFLRVVRTIGSYEHDGRFEAWLFRIAANLARDEARRRQRRGTAARLDERGDVGDGAWGERRGVAAPDDGMERMELGAQLEAALQRLSDSDREIIALRHYSELPFAEIAAMLGVPLGTALARAHRALGRLRAELERQGVTHG